MGTLLVKISSLSSLFYRSLIPCHLILFKNEKKILLKLEKIQFSYSFWNHFCFANFSPHQHFHWTDFNLCSQKLLPATLLCLGLWCSVQRNWTAWLEQCVLPSPPRPRSNEPDAAHPAATDLWFIFFLLRLFQQLNFFHCSLSGAEGVQGVEYGFLRPLPRLSKANDYSLTQHCNVHVGTQIEYIIMYSTQKFFLSRLIYIN